MENNNQTFALDNEDRKVIASLLHETREQFRNAFLTMANCDDKKTQRKFVSMSVSLMELAAGKYAGTPL